MYKLLVNDTKVYEGSSLVLLLKTAMELPLLKGSSVEIWQRARTQWRLLDGGIWR